MSVTIDKTKEGGLKISELQREINASPNIVPSCTSITASGTQLSLVFAAALSVDEETALDAIILAHVPPVKVMDVTELPISSLDGQKLSVHSSPKPEPDGITTYAVWAGSGDKLYDEGDPGVLLPAAETLGAGDLLEFDMTVGVPEVVKDIRFDPRHGRIWVHEAYLKFQDGGAGCSLTADIVAPATPLQQSVNLDYNIVDDWLIYAGPGAGTDGFAGSPVLVPRTYSNDGDWDYNGVSLTPNFTNTGGYKITTIERIIHRYINRIPLVGSVSNYFTLSSDESAELPVALGYFMRVTVTNATNTVWHVSAIMELYRERTYIT